jgi:mono/diheme cytochrome c family protein
MKSFIMKSCAIWPALIVSLGILSIANQAHAVWDAGGYYKMRCASCHGLKGEGTVAPPLAPPLRGNAFVINAPVAVIVQLIRHGRINRQRLYNEGYANMPSFGPEEIPDPEAIAQYLKTDLQKK